MRKLRFFLCAWLSLSASYWACYASDSRCDDLAVSLATSPVPPQSTYGLDAARKLINSQPKRSDIILIGDSLLLGWNGTLSSDIPKLSIWNLSVGANRTQNTLWMLNQLTRGNMNPEAIVILLGTNNLGDGGMIGCGVYEGIRAVVQKATRLWPLSPKFVVTILPRGADFLLFNEERKKANLLIDRIDEEFQNVFPVVVDDMTITCGNYGRESLAPNTLTCAPQSRYQCENYKDDNLHLTPAGYSPIINALRRTSLEGLRRDVFSAAR